MEFFLISRMWRNLKEVSALPEQEAMTRLLFHLRKVPGFRERAQELAESYGDPLNNNNNININNNINNNNNNNSNNNCNSVLETVLDSSLTIIFLTFCALTKFCFPI